MLLADFAVVVLCAVPYNRLHAGDAADAEFFEKSIRPILAARCYECHGDGKKKGGLSFDELTTKEQLLRSPQAWLKVLRNTRSHIMPPPGETEPTPGSATPQQ